MLLCLSGANFGKIFQSSKHYSFNSITSRSEKLPLSIRKRTKVRTVWKPYLPAAPGLMCSSPSLESYFTFRMCEWPLMNNRGGWVDKIFRTDGSYFPGYPPMCLMSTSVSSMVNRLISGKRRRMSCPSMLPYTARNGRKASSFCMISREPMSPACHISSHGSKYFR